MDETTSSPLRGGADREQPAPREEDRRYTRREVIGYGAAGALGLSLAGSVAWRLFRSVRGGDIGAVFKGDAPSDRLWELWQQRGWVKEASHYMKLGRNVQCKICPNNCLLEPGDRSHCRNKVNRDGTLYTMAYANPCAFHVDPIEKKPLFHFLPASQSFSIATSGCVLRCLNCQNWDISQRKPEETKDPRGPALRLRPPVPARLTLEDVNRVSMFPEDVVALAEEFHCASIAYTYSEPTAYYEYCYDTCRLARAGKVRNVLVSCGSMEERALRDLGQFVDAAHVDLKGFDDEIYRRLNSGLLQPILDTLKTLRDLGVWFEVINLVVPTYTDNYEMIARMCGWLVNTLGPDTPLHFSRFHPQHKLTALPPTPVDTLVRAQSIARTAGLHYVYIGNVPGLPEAETTFCPDCRKPVIERDIFAVTANHVRNGQCGYCQAKIAGVWA